MKYYEYPRPNYEMLRKIVTLTVEYSEYGGEENFIKEEDVLADSFSEAEAKLARYLGDREYKIKTYCWKKSVIDNVVETAQS